MPTRIVACSGNVRRPSRTGALVETTASDVARLRNADLEIYDRANAGQTIAVARRDALTLPAGRIVDARVAGAAVLERADRVAGERDRQGDARLAAAC